MKSKAWFFSACLIVSSVAFASDYAEPAREQILKDKSSMSNNVLMRIDLGMGVFELDDGSIWKVDSADKQKAAAWSQGDVLKFGVEQSWTKAETLSFKNTSKDSKVKASLCSFPEDYRGNAQWIAYIDPSISSLFLGNGSVFSLFPGDAHIFSNWRADDFISVGDYSVFYTPYTHVLFNFRTQEYVFGQLR